MAEPVSTGTFVAGVFAAAAGLFVKGALSAAGKDAYETLRSRIAAIFVNETSALEAKPESKGHALVLAESIDGQSGEIQHDYRNLAIVLKAALEAQGDKSSVDTRISVIASNQSVAVAGNLTAHDINLGSSASKGE